MPRYEVLRDYIMGSSAGNYKLIKGNIETLPSDNVSQRKLNILLAMKNPVLREWKPPEEFTGKLEG